MPDSDDLGSIVFALGADGGLRYVDDVPNGKRCGCVCPACKQPLIARNEGRKLAHHFAHVSGSCEWAVEAAVAYTVGEQVRQAGKVWLPPLTARDYDAGCEVTLSPAHVMPAAAASLRGVSGRHAPEVVVTVQARSGETQDFVLVVRLSHPVTDVQEASLRENGLGCVAFDLRRLRRELRLTEGRHYDRGELMLAVQDAKTLRRVVCEGWLACGEWLINGRRSQFEHESMDRRDRRLVREREEQERRRKEQEREAELRRKKEREEDERWHAEIELQRQELERELARQEEQSGLQEQVDRARAELDRDMLAEGLDRLAAGELLDVVGLGPVSDAPQRGTWRGVPWDMDVFGNMVLHAGQVGPRNPDLPWGAGGIDQARTLRCDGRVVLPATCRQLFAEFYSVAAADLGVVDASGARSLEEAFRGMGDLLVLRGLDRWDTSGVRDVTRIFHGCAGLRELDLSTWGLANAVRGEGMFTGCSMEVRFPNGTIRVGRR